LQNVTVNPSTVRNICLKGDIKTRYKRLLRLEEEKNGKDIEITEEQIKLLEKANHMFQRTACGKPLSWISSLSKYLYGWYGIIKGVGRIYLQAVVDTYGSFTLRKTVHLKAS